jgi:tRNA A37 methylthiotransferase MiaB
MEQVKYEQAYMFAYSMRPRTHAYRNYEDSVPDAVKHERLARLIAKFRECEAGKNEAEPGRTHLVLITEQSVKDGSKWKGLTNTSKRVFV